MTTLVCLISNQHIPNLLTVKAVRPDNLVLLVTEGMKKNVGWFLKALAAGGLDYSDKKRIIDIHKENSVEETISALQSAMAERSSDEWIINVTGGTKPMSIGAFTFAQENNLKAFYIVESDQHRAIDLLGGEPAILDDHHVTAIEFLAGYGYEIRNANDLVRQNQRASEWKDLGAMLTLLHDNPEVHAFLAKLQGMKEEKNRISRRRWEKEGLILTSGDGLWISNEDLRKRICTLFAVRDDTRVLTGQLDRTEVEFLTGRWLEYFIFGLLTPLMPAQVRCLQIGLTIGQPGPGESNEIDVSFMTERSLCIVECKTGSQRHDPKGDGVLYKMEAIKASLGAIRVKAFLAATSPNIIDPNTGDTREALQNRSRIYQCTIIHGGALKELAAQYLANDPLLSSHTAQVFRLGNPITTPR